VFGRADWPTFSVVPLCHELCKNWLTNLNDLYLLYDVDLPRDVLFRGGIVNAAHCPFMGSNPLNPFTGRE